MMPETLKCVIQVRTWSIVYIRNRATYAHLLLQGLVTDVRTHASANEQAAGTQKSIDTRAGFHNAAVCSGLWDLI